MTDTVTSSLTETSETDVEDQVLATARIFDLPSGPALGYVMGRLYDLDHGLLHFGKRYRVTQGVSSNLGDALDVGLDVRFVGADHRNGTELILHFETPNGDKPLLHFDQNAPQVPEKRRYLRDAAAHFRPVLFDFAARRKRLMAAQAVLFHLRDKHEVGP